MWPDTRLLDLLGLEVPIVQAPMAGADSPELAAAVSAAGGLGSLGCAMRSNDDLIAAARAVRERTNRAFNLNFFCHRDPEPDAARASAWIARLAPYYAELGVEPPGELMGGRRPFDAEICDKVVEIGPPVVSFHFGLPEDALLDRVREAGCRILCSATTPSEAAILAARGVDAVIAQGAEAGGHRGTFDPADWQAGLIGTLALVPQIVDRVDVPVIAAGGIADGRAIAACFALGASAVQLGTAYLRCPESAIGPAHRAALAKGGAADTVVTNVVTGRPARGLANRLVREMGPVAPDAPEFPLAAPAMLPLKAAAEARGSTDFTALWAGQAVALSRTLPAEELTRRLAEDARERLAALAARA